MISSYQIRAYLSHEMQKKEPNKTFKQCFDKIGKQQQKNYINKFKKIQIAKKMIK